MDPRARPTQVEEAVLGEPGSLAGLERTARRRRIDVEDPPGEYRNCRRDRRRNPLPPVCGEPGGRPSGRRRRVGVAHAELAGDHGMVKYCIEGRVACLIRPKHSKAKYTYALAPAPIRT